MLADTALKLTPLHDIHLALRARMVPFGGWQMPLQYEGILAEYQSTRCDATIFDTCHMGEFEVEGDPISCGLNQLVTCSLADMPPLSCRYGLLLNEHGGVIDDLIVYRKTENKWMIVVNASTMENDARQFQSYLSASAKFENISHRTGKLDIQGPQSREVLKNLVPGIERLKYYTFDIFPVLGEEVIVSRTGYTGELGYEIYNLGGDNPVTLMKFIQLIESRIGKKAKLNMLPMQPGDVKETFADISKARRELGFSPKVKIDEGVNIFVDWFMESR